MEIVDLDDYRKVWSTGAAACAACGHEWQAVYPIGAEDVGLECPSCGSGHGSVLTNTQMAKRMWEAYAIRLGGKNYKGEPLKSWDNLDDVFQYCWIGVSEVISERTFKLEADNERLRKASKRLGEIATDAVEWLPPASVNGPREEYQNEIKELTDGHC